jgi:transcriptional regulator with XRE-family HTH domain
MENDLSIGVKIKKIRELRNYTQEYMAEQLGLSQAGYGNIERDDTEGVTLIRLKQIAKVLGIALQELLGFDEKKILIGEMNNNATGMQNGIYYGNDNFERERKLYDAQIEQLKEENKYLKSLLDRKL